jgi:hypothetical protein
MAIGTQRLRQGMARLRIAGLAAGRPSDRQKK